MPIYEYRCQGCGEHTEKLQKISDAPISECPHCKKPQLQRLISAASFHLKGTGWYATDFKGDKKKPEDKKDVTTKKESKPKESKTDK